MFDLKHIAAGFLWQDIGDFTKGKDGGAQPLGKVQVVFIQRVFGSVRASGQAPAAKMTTLAVRAFAVKKRIRRHDFRGAEVNTIRRRAVCLLSTHFFSGFFEIFILDIGRRVVSDTQHGGCSFIMRGQLQFPVDSHFGPGRVIVEIIFWFQQDRCIYMTAAANADSPDKGHMLEKILGKIPGGSQRRQPV